MNSVITSYLTALRSFNRDVQLYLLAAALLGLSYFGFVTVLLNLYLLRLGYGPTFIGWVNGSTALAFALSSLLSGVIGSRWGYRRAAVVGMSLISAGILILPLMEFVAQDWQDLAIVVTRLFSGWGFSMYMVNANPYLVAVTTPAERTHVFSLQVALLPLAGFAGNIVAGVAPAFLAGLLSVPVDHPAPYRYSLMASGVILFPAIVAIFSTREINGNGENAANSVETELRAVFPVALVAVLALTTMMRMAGEGAARSFYNVYLDTELSISTARIGLLIAISQIIAGPSAMAAPFLESRFGKVPTIVSATVGIAGSLILMGLIPHWLVVSLGFMGVIGMLSITRSVMNVMQMEIVPPTWRAATSGIISMAMGTGFSSMTLGGGYLITAAGYRPLFFLGAGLVTASALVFWLYFRIPRGEYVQAAYKGA